jgi:hypothetical protein
MVGIALGTVATGLIVYGLCVPILSVTGRYDVMTQLAAYCQGQGSELAQLKQDCIQACQANAVVEEEAKDFKKSAKNDDEPKDYTEKTMTADQSGRKVSDDDEGDEKNINDVSEASFNI